MFLLRGLPNFEFARCSYPKCSRAITGVSENSQQITINKKDYFIQQSVGQASVMGTYKSNEMLIIQGFIQPYAWNTIVNKEFPLDLTSSVYPNPFFETVQANFNEIIKTSIDVQVYDVLGKQVYSTQFSASQKIEVKLADVSEAVLHIENHCKQKTIFEANSKKVAPL